LKLTSLYGHDPKEGSFMRSLLHIDPHNLTFIEEADGWRKAVLDVIAVTFGDNGRVVDQENRTYTLRVRNDTYQKVMRSGFLYTLIVPVKKAGAYQLRVAVRDSTSERIGSANQFIEVPDIGKNRLTLSGIVVTGKDPAKANKASEVNLADQTGGTQEGGDSEADLQASPAMRRMRNGLWLDYGYMVYNAQLDRATNRPQLESQLVLYREGKPVYTGQVRAVDPGQQVDLKHIAMGGRIQLGSDLVPGDYVLQIIITDKLAKEKYRAASQWIDFEIVK
jgi:hypothetical protein